MLSAIGRTALGGCDFIELQGPCRAHKVQRCPEWRQIGYDRALGWRSSVDLRGAPKSVNRAEKRLWARAVPPLVRVLAPATPALASGEHRGEFTRAV
jgi:hypothetical protein